MSCHGIYLLIGTMALDMAGIHSCLHVPFNHYTVACSWNNKGLLKFNY